MHVERIPNREENKIGKKKKKAKQNSFKMK